MFSVWPELFAFELVAVFVLRVVAGYFFLLFGSKLFRAARMATEQKKWVRIVGMLYALAQLCIGTLLVVGAYTQPAALAGLLISLLPIGSGGRASKCEQHVQLLLFSISLSLLFLGPGVFAFDLPI